MIKIYPSLLAAQRYDMKSLEPYCAGFHLDIMDGEFVPSTGLSIETVNSVDATSKHPSWVHLMVANPLSWIGKLTIKPNSIVSFHSETGKDIESIIKKIRKNSWKASLAISPKTAISQSYPYLATIDQILIMSVEPGYSGQHFLPSALAKVAPLIEQRKKHNLHFTIGIDGGVRQQNIESIAAAHIDAVAIGSAIFTATDPVQALKKLAKICKK